MLTSRFHTIPRFAVPCTLGDFRTGLGALLARTPPVDAFGLAGRSAKFWTRSGRQALRLILTGLEMPRGSGVALPLFTDPSLAEAVVAAGHRPVFIDVDPNSLTIDPQSLDAARGKFSAVVIVHLFGHLADLPALTSAAGGAAIVEDTAHAPLSFWNGRMAGEFGLASFYSFASTKYWPAGGGGMAVVHDRDLAARVARQVGFLAAPSRAREMQSLALQAAKTVVFHRCAYGLLGKPLRRWVERLALLEPSLDLTAIERPHAAVALRQASRFAARVQRQRANSLRLLSRLAEAEDVVLPREPFGATYNYHLFPVVLRSPEERAAVTAAMWKEFVDTSTIYSGSIELSRRFGYRGGCPVSESVAERLITLPNYAALTRPEIDAVAEAFLAALRSSRDSRYFFPLTQLGARVDSPREPSRA